MIVLKTVTYDIYYKFQPKERFYFVKDVDTTIFRQSRIGSFNFFFITYYFLFLYRSHHTIINFNKKYLYNFGNDQLHNIIFSFLPWLENLNTTVFPMDLLTNITQLTGKKNKYFWLRFVSVWCKFIKVDNYKSSKALMISNCNKLIKLFSFSIPFLPSLPLPSLI